MITLNPGEIASLSCQRISLNVGPQHPSTHGVLRMVVELDGEVVVKVTPHMGYLHTGFEKTMEHRTYLQNVAFAPRTDYVHPFSHELAYVLAVEKLLKCKVPERASVIRVILHELGRLSSHLIFFGAGLMDLGALTPFFFCFREREKILDLFEEISGYRLNQGYLRVGGLLRDAPDGWEGRVGQFLRDFGAAMPEYERLFWHNPIFRDRTVGIGVVDAETALDIGMTGPNLRASGVPLDHRRANPYCGYETYDFDLPISDAGDCFARFQVRFEEMLQSRRIIEQALKKLKPGPIKDPNRKISLPPRQELETSMEAVIHHFKLVTEGFHPPSGEVYVPVETARGEAGYYLVSDGGSLPYRIKLRAPSFSNIQVLEIAPTGHTFADLITVVASIDFMMGDVDK